MGLLIFILTLTTPKDPISPLDICRVVERLIITEGIGQELVFQSKIVGNCTSVIYWNDLLKDQFHTSIGHHDCDTGRLAILDFEKMFAENVHKALRIDSVIQRRHSLYITYSIIAFSTKSQVGFSESVLRTKRIKMASN